MICQGGACIQVKKRLLTCDHKNLEESFLEKNRRSRLKSTSSHRNGSKCDAHHATTTAAAAAASSIPHNNHHTHTHTTAPASLQVKFKPNECCKCRPPPSGPCCRCDDETLRCAWRPSLERRGQQSCARMLLIALARRHPAYRSGVFRDKLLQFLWKR
jgi:hypothetical protein